MAKLLQTVRSWLQNNPQSCTLVLPGRGQDALCVMYSCKEMGLRNLIGLTPQDYEWYPSPNGPNDQEDALVGIEEALKTIWIVLGEIEYGFGIGPEKITLAGFSAGAVMALHAGTRLRGNFERIISMSGSILESRHIPVCPQEKKTTQFVLAHHQDDPVFDWSERYLPTKIALLEKGYYVKCIENIWGGHCIQTNDFLS